MYYDKHIFCCINQRDENFRKSCGNCASGELAKYMKKKCKAMGINKSIRVNTSSCLNRCEEGPVMVIYPEGIWYSFNSEKDIDRIIDHSIMSNKIVNDLVLSDENEQD